MGSLNHLLEWSVLPLPRTYRDFLRPIGWRGKTPRGRDLDGCMVFDRDRLATSFDATEIAYAVHGETGPWVALVPGYCCPDNFWRYLLPELARDHRVIVYDLRGLGRSGLPRPPGYRALKLSPDDFTMTAQVRDLVAVLDAAGVDRVALIGHSMGGQIVLEAYREIPERVSAVVMLTAPFESPLRTFYGRDFNNLYHGLRLFITALPRPAILMWRALFLANPGLTHQVAQLVRALGPHARLEDMTTYYRHMAYLDPLVMLMMAESMRSHSAADVLPVLKVPTLIVAGTLDTFTPVTLAESMWKAISHAELTVIEGVSHGAVIEKPDEVNAAVRSFLARHIAR